MIRKCACGADISHRHINTKRCLDCRATRDAESTRTSQAKNKELGIKPKKNIYQKPREYSCVD